MVHAPLEIEVKFHLPEIKPVRDHLLAMGATHSGRVFETNIRFEDASKTLRKRGLLLRLRKDDRILLTFKSNLSRPDTQFKVHRELEVEVGDFRVCHSILEGMGFHPEQAYEKWRETFVLNNTQLLIDTMPYGVFLEIEGQKSDIRDIADRIGLRWEKRILLNYLEIFEIVRREEGLGFTDITFENFETIHLDIGKHLSLLYAG
ncbi:MAG: class IV adenylate cyclase [Deltaproteobacteria bacterium]|nr:class IV adenylate cyclase [Deltaproteobacteria bacterium]